MDVSTWLRDLGLENYVQAFQEHDIDADVLPRLTLSESPSYGSCWKGRWRRRSKG
jgi:hypothetical protein